MSKVKSVILEHDTNLELPIPLGKRVLVRRLSEEDHLVKTNSGLFVQRDQINTDTLARVMKLGTDCTNNLEEGDVVLVTDYSGRETEFKGQSYFLIQEPEILAIINKANLSKEEVK